MPSQNRNGSQLLFKLSFEVINGTEITFDSGFQVALQGSTGFQAFPEQAVVSVAARVVTQYGFVSRQLIQFSDQFFSRQVSKFRQASSAALALLT